MVWSIMNTLKINNRNMLRNSVTLLRNVTQGDIYIVPCYGNCYGDFFHAGCGSLAVCTINLTLLYAILIRAFTINY
jgi:hypothetical protein